MGCCANALRLRVCVLILLEMLRVYQSHDGNGVRRVSCIYVPYRNGMLYTCAYGLHTVTDMLMSCALMLYHSTVQFYEDLFSLVVVRICCFFFLLFFSLCISYDTATATFLIFNDKFFFSIYLRDIHILLLYIVYQLRHTTMHSNHIEHQQFFAKKM